MTISKELLSAIERSRLALASNQQALESYGHGVSIEFWVRIIENSSSVALMLQHGFATGAMAIHRISIEHFANFVGLLKGKCDLEDLKKQAEQDLVKQAKLLKERDGRTSVLTEENKVKLAGFLKKLDAKTEKNSGVNTYNLLDGCGFDFLYTQYRLLSIGAAHSTLVSIIQPPTEEVEKLKQDVVDLLDLTKELTADFIRKKQALF